MYQLLQGNVMVKGKKKSKVAFSRQPISWTQDMQDTVDDVIDYLKSPGFLAFPDWNTPFTLHVDASQKGLGAVLYQKIDDKDRVISFASRTLTPAEKKYHLHSGKLEFLSSGQSRKNSPITCHMVLRSLSSQTITPSPT